MEEGREWYSVYWLYWYISTNTDAEALVGHALFGLSSRTVIAQLERLPGTQFTCFTSTNRALGLSSRTVIAQLERLPGTHFTCFSSTKVQH